MENPPLQCCDVVPAPDPSFGLGVTRSKPKVLLYKRWRLLFTSLARHGGAGRGVLQGCRPWHQDSGGSENAGAAHSDGFHDGALAARPGAWWRWAEAAAHRHLAEHRHAHHAAVLLHGEGVHTAQTQALCLR